MAKVDMDRKINLLRNMIIRRSIVNLLITLKNKGPMTFRDLKKHGAKQMDRTTDLLAITKKEFDENHIVLYKLTEKGERLAQCIEDLIEILDEFLPEDS